MRRIALLLLVLAAPVSAQTTAGATYRLAELAPSDASLKITRDETLPELAKLGFREGTNLIVDERTGDAHAMEGLVRELLSAKPNVIIAIGPEAISAAAGATKTVPIVTFGADPVQLGYAATIARPGGNVTGVVILAETLDAKRVELLHEAVPSARRVAALLLPSLRYRQSIEREVRAVAANRGFEPLIFDAEGPDDYKAAFAAMNTAGAQALLITGNPTFNRDAALLARLAVEMRLPIMCEWAANARSGCLIGYGPSQSELRRRLAHYVARIFQGDAPGELPIETPTHFELAVNLTTAKALGLTIPLSLLARADEVIE